MRVWKEKEVPMNLAVLNFAGEEKLAFPVVLAFVPQPSST